MIVGIEGIVELKEPTRVHINVHGLVYEVHISINTANRITESHTKLHVTQIIREDAHLLFGFGEIQEQKMFETLLKINGIGPRVALAVCSTFSPKTFASVVSTRDVTMLKRVPGIGPKAAGRILVELADFVMDTDQDGTHKDNPFNEAMMALESLGFKPEATRKALKDLQGDTASMVKEALKRLQRL